MKSRRSGFSATCPPDFFLHHRAGRIVAGGNLPWNEVYGLRPVALISENLARELWGSPSAAVGKRFRRYIGFPWQEVIGVVQDVRENGLQEPAPLTVYWPTFDPGFGPFPRNAQRAVTFAIRSDRAGTEGFLNQVRQAVWSGQFEPARGGDADHAGVLRSNPSRELRSRW